MALENKKTKKTTTRKSASSGEKTAKKATRRKTASTGDTVATGGATAVATVEQPATSRPSLPLPSREGAGGRVARKKTPAGRAKPTPAEKKAAERAKVAAPARDAGVPLVWDDEDEPQSIIVVPPRPSAPGGTGPRTTGSGGMGPRTRGPVVAEAPRDAQPWTPPREPAPPRRAEQERPAPRPVEEARPAPRPRDDGRPPRREDARPPRREDQKPVRRDDKPAPPPVAPKLTTPRDAQDQDQDQDQDAARRGRKRRRRGRGRGRTAGEPAAETPNLPFDEVAEEEIEEGVELIDRPEPDPDLEEEIGLTEREAPTARAAPAPRADRNERAPRDDREDGPRGRRGRRRRGPRGDEPVAERGAPLRGKPVEVDEADIEEREPEDRDHVERGGHDDDDLVEAAGKVVDVEGRDWEDRGDDAEKPDAAATREMLINVSAGDEVRIAVLESGKLEELFIEREGTQSMVGNIYKGRITNVEPSIQAVFIDFGTVKNGFLHISDVQPQYFGKRGAAPEDVGRKIPRHSRPPIQECFRRGQEVIVQITKDGLGTKGPTLTTYLSIPGRFLVMMPGMNKLGVSRKIEDDDERRKMREVLDQLELPSGFGFILRTAGTGRNRRELQRDLNYLMRLWRTVAERVKRDAAPAELYRESDLVTRTIRDTYTQEFRRLIVDDPVSAEKAKLFLQIVMPRSQSPVELYTDREPLFHRYGLETEIEKINMRHVPLPSGGSIVIDSTEAMVAIDVNSGKFRTPDDPEQTALKINVEAAEEIARQLRLRDLGGLIVCDFIDMRFERNRKTVEKAIRDALKKHKERARVLRMSAFGLIEITRQRHGPSIKRNIYNDCPHCKGTGLVKMPESVMLDVMRIVQLASHRDDVQRVLVNVSSDVAHQILNSKRAVLAAIEQETGRQIIVRGEPGFTPDEVSFRCEDAQGRIAKFTAGAGTEVAGVGHRRR